MKKELLKLEASNDLKKHKQHMEQLRFQKELENLKFDHSSQSQRIKTAGIRRAMERKEDYERLRKGR